MGREVVARTFFTAAAMVAGLTSGSGGLSNCLAALWVAFVTECGLIHTRCRVNRAFIEMMIRIAARRNNCLLFWISVTNRLYYEKSQS